MASHLRIRLISLILPFLCVVFGACGSEAAGELEQLRTRVQTLENDNRQLRSDVERRQGEVDRLRRELKEKEAMNIGLRIGLTQPEQPLFATIETSMGRIVTKLYWREAPQTVQNFVALAEGEREWRDPATGQGVNRPFYDGLTIHRVVPDFAIQAGAPNGDSRYTPGYTLPDELDAARTFSKPGMLAMASSGPDTNGSQFFISLAAPHPELPASKYTIFGEVIEGLDVAQAIGKAPRDSNERPTTPIVIKRVRIGRGQPAA